jgi:hypothetical protein
MNGSTSSPPTGTQAGRGPRRPSRGRCSRPLVADYQQHGGQLSLVLKRPEVGAQFSNWHTDTRGEVGRWLSVL